VIFVAFLRAINLGRVNRVPMGDLRVSLTDAGFTDVVGAPAQDFDLQGHGPADLFSGGRRYSISWDLSNPDAPLRFVDAAGRPVRLPAGLTWVHLVDPGTAIAVA